MELWLIICLTLYGLIAVGLFFAVLSKRDKESPLTVGFFFGLIAVSLIWFLWIPYYGITTLRRSNKDASVA